MWRATIGVLLWLSGHAHAGELTGVVYDRDTGERLVGATVVAASPALAGMRAEITDEAGWYRIAGLPAGLYELTVYYADSSATHTGIAVAADAVVPVVLHLHVDEYICGLPIMPCCSAPIIEQGAEVNRNVDPLFHMPRPAWRFPMPADLRVDGVPWPAGAPPPPDAFIDELTIWHAGVLTSRGTAPAADIVLQSGSNDASGILATRLGHRGTESAARFGVPLARDRLWFAGGIATGASLALFDQLTYAHTPDHQLRAFAYADRHPAAEPSGPVPAAATPTAPRDIWVGGATWRSRFDDNKLDITLTAGASRAARGDRFAAAGVTRRFRLLGHHIASAGVEHTAATTIAFAEDSWQPIPELTAELGVRYDHATRAGHPRAGLVYDWTQEGRSRAFAVISDTELSGGAEYEVIEDLALLAAWRHTATEHGPVLGARLRGTRRELGVHYELDRPAGGGELTSRLLAHGIARFDLCFARSLFAGVLLSRAVRGLPPGSDSAGLQLGKRLSMTDDLDLSLAADLVATASERSAWLAVRIDL